MFDTRAAIRELRSLSEKRSVSTLTEAEQVRWVALRQKLGLPLEVSVEAAAPEGEVASSASAPEAERQLAVEAVPAAPPPVAEEPGPEAPATQAAPEPEARWSGPALDTAASHPADAGWKGPALEVPAWADRLSERTTDPGLEAPPPLPFDDAPAARPPHAAEAADLGGRPDEPVPLAPAAEFVSYSRQGEALDLPAESPAPEGIAQRGLAELAHAASEDVRPGPPVPDLTPEPEAVPPVSARFLSEEAAAQALLAEAIDVPSPAGPLGLSGAPLDERAALEPPVPPPVPESLPVEPSLAVPVDVPPAPEPVPEEAPSLLEGAIAITPAPLFAEAPLPFVPPGAALYAPRPLTPEPGSAEPSTPVTPATSIWGPGAVAPPMLAAHEFGSSGEALSTDGLDPWPEPPPPEPPVPESPFAAPLNEATAAAEPPVEEDGVETVSDEDLVHEAVTPTPLPILPPPPSGSGGIRGFQFPRPPGPMVVPVPPTSQSFPRTRTAPSMPAPSVPLTSTPRAPAPSVPLTSTPRVPAPLRLDTPVTPVPRPAPAAAASPAPRAAPPGVLLRTPVPATAAAQVTPRPSVSLRIATPPPPVDVAPPAAAPGVPPRTPVPAAAVAPATPRPAAPQKVVTPPPPATAPPVAPPGVLPRTPVPPSATAPATPAPLRLATPAPAPRMGTPPVLAPAPPSEDEGALPLLELVDEVEPPPPARVETRPAITPTPGAGTGVFGPPMILNPGFVEGFHRVVIHTLEGQVHRGTVHDIDLQDEALLVAQNDGREIRIPARRVKAVFFVLAPGESAPRPRGERVQVTFRDGRQVVGHSEDHASGEPGFFVVPSDARTNTSRVYVYRGGIQSITAG